MGIATQVLYELILVNIYIYIYIIKINIKMVKISINVQYASQLTFIEIVYIDFVFTH